MATKTVVLPSELQKKKDTLAKIQARRASGDLSITGAGAKKAVETGVIPSSQLQKEMDAITQASRLGQAPAFYQGGVEAQARKNLAAGTPAIVNNQQQIGTTTPSSTTPTGTTTNVQQGTFFVRDGKVYERRGETLVNPFMNMKDTERVLAERDYITKYGLPEDLAKFEAAQMGIEYLTPEQQTKAKKTRLEQEVENAKEQAKLKAKQEESAYKQQQEMFARGESATKTGIISGREGLQANAPIGQAITAGFQTQTDELNRVYQSTQLAAEESARQLEYYKQTGQTELAAQEANRLLQLKTKADTAQKNLLEEERLMQSQSFQQQQQKSANFLNTSNFLLETIPPSALANMTVESVQSFYSQGGSEIDPIKAEWLISSSKDIAELEKSKNEQDRLDAQLKRRQLMVSIKNAQENEAQKAVQNYRELKTALDNGQISQEYFDLKTGAKDKAQKFTFQSADGVAYAFDPSTGTARVLNQSEAPSYGNVGNGNITQQYGSTSPLTADNVKLQNGVVGTPGIDFDGNIGDPVQSFVSGTVTQVTEAGGYGNQIIVTDAEGNQHMYSHLKDLDVPVSVGDTVTAGQLLGFMGNTGNVVKSATGDGSHLDYRVKSQNLVNGSPWVDPNKFISKKNSKKLYDEAQFLVSGGTADEREKKINTLVRTAQEKNISIKEAKKLFPDFLTEQDQEVKDQVKNSLSSSSQAIKDYQEISRQYKTAQSLSEGKSGIQDLALIVSFLKTIDPGSVARESEVGSVESARSLYDDLLLKAQKISSGKKLSKEQKEEILSSMEALKKAADESQYERLIKGKMRIEERGVENTIVDENEIKKLERQLGDRAVKIQKDLGIITDKKQPENVQRITDVNQVKNMKNFLVSEFKKGATKEEVIEFLTSQGIDYTQFIKE